MVLSRCWRVGDRFRVIALLYGYANMSEAIGVTRILMSDSGKFSNNAIRIHELFLSNN